MTAPWNCQIVKEHLDAYVLGALEPREARLLEAHLDDCLGCWHELTEAQEAIALLALAAPRHQPPPGLRQRILARARPKSQPRRRFVPTPGFLVPALPILLLALAAVGLAWAINLQGQVRGLQSENRRLAAESLDISQAWAGLATLAAADVRRLELVARPPLAGAHATYLWSSESRLGVLLAEGLSPPPAGQVYQVWLTFGDRRQTGGTFWPRPDGTLLHVERWEMAMPGPFTWVGVTLEPTRGGPDLRGPVLLSGTVPQ